MRRKITYKQERFLMNMQLMHKEIHPVQHANMYKEVTSIFAMLRMRPAKYQIGHKFYINRHRGYFYLLNDEDIELAEKGAGVLFYWLPTIDELFNLAYHNNITLSFFPSRRRIHKTYTVLVDDPLFPATPMTELQRYTSDNLWLCFAHSLARALRRRMTELGLEYVNTLIYTDDVKFYNNPVSLTDHQQEDDK